MSHCKSFRTLSLALFMALLAAAPQHLWAGWVITARITGRDGSTQKVKYYIDNQRYKAEKGNISYTCDFKSESLLVADNDEFTCLSTSVSTYAAKLRSDRLAQAYKVLQSVPEKEKPDWETKLRKQAIEAVSRPEPDDDSLIIKKLPDTAVIAGYAASKYSVTYGRSLKEQLFYTNKISFLTEADAEQLLFVEFLMNEDARAQQYLFAGSYISLMSKGLVVKRIIFLPEGLKTEWQIEKIEEKRISDAEFGKPAMYKELSPDQWFSQQKGEDQYFYDDYE